MGRYWDKPNGKTGQEKNYTEEPQETLNFREETEMESWDFRRDPAGHTCYGFSKRQADPNQYRVLGKGNAALAYETAPNESSRRVSQNVRANRYNASVKMVAGDSGPAPWDWEKVSYKRMPVVGEVAAGRYDVTVAYHEPGYGPDADFVMVNPSEVKIGQDTFALRVRGQSMIDNEIDDGDIIIVQAQDWADDGDFVIACLTDSTDPYGFVTLKRFYRHRHADRIVLQPANQSLSPIHILPRKGDHAHEDLDGVKIQGRVTAIIKNGGVF